MTFNNQDAAGRRARRTALITGASSGIGAELAKVFARAGYDLVLVARSEDRLRALQVEVESRHAIAARVLAVDLADPAAPATIHARLEQEGVVVHALVNDAGFGVHGPFAETDLAAELAMIQVNVAALTQLTKLFSPAMLGRGHGRILNVASTAAFQPGPLMAVYYATKAYVLSFSEALAEELRGTGVTVTTLCPGPTRTPFQERANLGGSFLANRFTVMDAATVARAGYRGLVRGEALVIPGLLNRLTPVVVRLTPRPLVRRIVRAINARH